MDDVFDDVAGSPTSMAAEDDDEDAHLVTINFKSNSIEQPDSPTDKTPLAKGSGNPEPGSPTAPKASTNKDSAEQPGEQAVDPSNNLETTPMIDDDEKDKKT